MSGFIRTCTKCGASDKVNSHKQSLSRYCRPCYNKINTEAKVRVCIDCGNIKQCSTTRDAQAKRCKNCSAKDVAKNRKGTTSKIPKIVYWYFCSKCDKVQMKTKRQGSCWCQSCSRTRLRKPEHIYFDFEEMKMRMPKRYFVICPDCPPEIATREVSQSMFSQKGAIVRCRSCASKAKPKKYKKTNTQIAKESRPMSKTKKTSIKAIEKEIEKNREYKSILESEKKKAIPEQKLTDKQMMDLWLKSHKPTVVPDVVTDLQLVTGIKTSFCLEG